MSAPGPVDHGGDAKTPLFFVSHAVPRGVDADGESDDDLLQRFFDDLSSAVAALLSRPDGGGLGFLSRLAHTEAEITGALNAARAFVPLLSPQYIRSLPCGQQWAAFHKLVKNGGEFHRILPMTWDPVTAEVLPTTVSQSGRPIRWDDPEATTGLYSMLIDEDEGYQGVIDETAGLIARAAMKPLPPPPVPIEVSLLKSVFVTSPRRIHLRIVVLAPTADRLPVGRAATGRYGPGQLDWVPFDELFARTLAAECRELIDRWNYTTDIVAFDDLADLHDAAPTAPPTLLIIDNWALLDPVWRDRVSAYAAVRQAW